MFELRKEKNQKKKRQLNSLSLYIIILQSVNLSTCTLEFRFTEKRILIMTIIATLNFHIFFFFVLFCLNDANSIELCFFFFAKEQQKCKLYCCAMHIPGPDRVSLLNTQQKKKEIRFQYHKIFSLMNKKSICLVVVDTSE